MEEAEDVVLLGKAENFDREGRAGLDAVASLVVDEGANAAPLLAGDDDVSDGKRAALHQDGGDGTTAAVEVAPR